MRGPPHRRVSSLARRCGRGPVAQGHWVRERGGDSERERTGGTHLVPVDIASLGCGVDAPFHFVAIASPSPRRRRAIVRVTAGNSCCRVVVVLLVLSLSACWRERSLA